MRSRPGNSASTASMRAFVCSANRHVEVLGHGHARHDADVEQPLVEQDVAHFVVGPGPAEAEAVAGRAGRARPAGPSVRFGVRLAPGAARFGAARQRGVDEGQEAAAAPARPRRYSRLGPGQRRHDQIRRLAVGPHEIEERPVARDELVLGPAPLEDGLGVLAARRAPGQGEGQVADFDGIAIVRFDLHRPIEHACRPCGTSETISGRCPRRRSSSGRRPCRNDFDLRLGW